MIAEALAFLIRNLAVFFILNLLLRFYLQVARASFSHPLAQFTVKLTNPLVLPLRRYLPAVAGYDSASLLLAWLSCILMHILLVLLSPITLNLLNPAVAVGLAMLGMLEVLKLSFYLLFGAVLVQAVMSWVNPYNPLAPILDKLSKPFLQPLRRLMPDIGGIDLSPLLLILLIQMVLNFIVAPLEQRLFGFVVMG